MTVEGERRYELKGSYKSLCIDHKELTEGGRKFKHMSDSSGVRQQGRIFMPTKL